MTLLFLLWIACGSLGAAIAYAIEAGVRYCARRKKSKSAELSDLDALVQQERLKQSAPLLQAVAPHMPLDVKAFTVILFYSDGHSMALECDVHRLKVEP